MKITLIVADDHTLFRESLTVTLSHQSQVEVIGQAGTGRIAVELAQQLQPQVILMDIRMPDLNGIDATRHIKTQFPQIKILALSGYADRQHVSDAIKAGASGYLLKTCSINDLLQAILIVMQNQVYLSPSVTNFVIEQYVNPESSAHISHHAHLSNRENEVLKLLAEGHTTKKIASTLNVSIKTVASHREHIMKKLDMYSIAELTRYAIREKLTTL